MSILFSLLRFYPIRLKYVQFRYWYKKNRMKFSKEQSSNIGEQTIAHNLSAFEQSPSAVFGCNGRMGLLIYPVISYYVDDRWKLNVLIVGCRSEDDIFWMRSYGFSKTIGFDLFSYSSYILVGDIHNTSFEDNSFDVVLLGWMISYSKDPACVVNECRRILKTEGLLGIGLDHNPNQDIEGIRPPRVNTLNSSTDIIDLLDSNMKHKVVFEYDHYPEGDYRCVVISRVLKS